MGKDWFGEWFRILEEAGEQLDLICGQLDEEKRTVEWWRMAHRDFDGVGAIMEMIERGGGTVTLPKRRLQAVPLLERIRVFVRYSRTRPVLAQALKMRTTETNHPAGVAWVALSREDTERVKARVTAERVRETAYLLHCLHKSACELSLVTNEVPAWLVPVNLRGMVEPLDRPKGNHASFVTISLPHEARAMDADRELLTLLRQKAHLGAWMAVNMGALIGPKRFRKRTLSMFDNPLGWSGCFSNLGAWPGDQATLTDRLQSPAVGCPPVWRKVPLSVGCITWNGRLTFGFSVHAWLTGDPEIAQKLAKRFIDHALGEGGPESQGTLFGFSPWSEIQQSERIAAAWAAQLDKLDLDPDRRAPPLASFRRGRESGAGCAESRPRGSFEPCWLIRNGATSGAGVPRAGAVYALLSLYPSRRRRVGARSSNACQTRPVPPVVPMSAQPSSPHLPIPTPRPSTRHRLLDLNGRVQKPRTKGITILLDVGQLGPRSIADLISVAADHCDYAKLAWGSALITKNLHAKLGAYREIGITPLLGGTLFEYAYLRNRVPVLLDLARDYKVHVEISDGVIALPRADKLRWISEFARHVEVFSELGGKVEAQDHDWEEAIREELSAGSTKVVIEGREISRNDEPLREDFLEMLGDVADIDDLVFEALERRQQVALIKRFGPNVNLGNIQPRDLMTVESFRLGLKEHTLLHTWGQNAEERHE